MRQIWGGGAGEKKRLQYFEFGLQYLVQPLGVNPTYSTFKLKAVHHWIQWCHRLAQFSLNSICAIKSTIPLEIKCPQLSKPEATAARSKYSIGDRMKKKKLGRNQAQSGGQFSSGYTNQQVVQRTHLVPMVFSRWPSRWRCLHCLWPFLKRKAAISRGRICRLHTS